MASARISSIRIGVEARVDRKDCENGLCVHLVSSAPLLVNGDGYDDGGCDVR